MSKSEGSTLICRVSFLLSGPSKNYRQIVHVAADDGREWQFPVPWDESDEAAVLAAASVTGGIPVGNAGRDESAWKVAVDGAENGPYWFWTYFNPNKATERWIVYPREPEACASFEVWYEAFYGPARFSRSRGRKNGGFFVVSVRRTGE